MLVALPSAIAFGVTVFAPLGGSFAAEGALAGILGTTALGIIAPTFGGTNRLISSPSAPAAAVLAALAVELMREDVSADRAALLLMLVAFLCGVIQLAFGAARLGRLIKYMPYPVASGYLSGVGLVIVVGQFPKLLGTPKGTSFWRAVREPALWDPTALTVGAVTIAVMLLAPRITKAVPAAILALLSGAAAYFALGVRHTSLLALAGNRFVVGPFAARGGFLAGLTERAHAVGTMQVRELSGLLVPALTLAVLLSIDTLKTSVVLDVLTRSRHNSNRELVGQGLGNVGAALVGGIPGSGGMGVTLINMASGAQTPLSGVIEGVLALVAFLFLGNLIAWIPLASLAGILMVVGVRMFDRNSLQLLRSRDTLLDFAVIVAVAVLAQAASLIVASAVGIGAAMLLFIREQVGGSVVRRKSYGNLVFSRRARLPEEMAVLERCGGRTVIFELQGSLFFGTADQLMSALEPELSQRRYVILDMRRVLDVDVTAARVLQQIEDTLMEHDGFLMFCHFALRVPSGRDLERLFGALRIVRPEHHARVFETRDDALEWTEERILEEEKFEVPKLDLLDLREMVVLAGRKEETYADLEACMETRHYKAGEQIFTHGDPGHELFLIRGGLVRILLPIAGRMNYHVATFGRGDFFGEISFLGAGPRTATALAYTNCELFALPRAKFNTLAGEHKMLAIQLLEGIALCVATRLRRTDKQLRILQEG